MQFAVVTANTVERFADFDAASACFGKWQERGFQVALMVADDDDRELFAAFDAMSFDLMATDFD